MTLMLVFVLFQGVRFIREYRNSQSLQSVIDLSESRDWSIDKVPECAAVSDIVSFDTPQLTARGLDCAGQIVMFLGTDAGRVRSDLDEISRAVVWAKVFLQEVDGYSWVQQDGDVALQVRQYQRALEQYGHSLEEGDYQTALSYVAILLQDDDRPGTENQRKELELKFNIIFIRMIASPDLRQVDAGYYLKAMLKGIRCEPKHFLPSINDSVPDCLTLAEEIEFGKESPPLPTYLIIAGVVAIAGAGMFIFVRWRLSA
jgi:hypothetical protein